MNRKLNFILLAGLLLLSFSACGENTPGTTESPGSPEPTEITDDLPPLDFKGAEINIITREMKPYDVGVEEQNGETINDAVFFRNIAVENQLNVKINAHKRPGEWPDLAGYVNTVKNSVLSGAGA